MLGGVTPSPATAQRITQAATAILREHGRSAVTVRAVAASAGVQAPAIYRAFGDMYGLFASVATEGFRAYLERKRGIHETDPVAALRAAWDVHVNFGLDEPGLYLLMYGDPTRTTTCDGAAESWSMLLGTLRAVEQAGRLAVPVERAAQLVHGASMGITLTLIGEDPLTRDTSLAADAREATFAAVLRPDPANEGVTSGAGTRPELARALRGALGDGGPLTPGQRALLAEILDELSDS